MSDFKLQSLAPNLMVADVNQSIQFYQDVLNFDLIQSVPDKGILDWAMITRDNVTIMLHKASSMQQEYQEFQNSKPGASIILYIGTQDIDSLYQKIANKCTLCKQMHTTFYGKKEFSIQDPDSYLLTFSENQ